MASAWMETGPVSSPPKSVAYGAGALLVVLAFVGVGMGLRAAWRESGAPDLGGRTASSVADADTLTAKPIVELPTPPAASNTAENAAGAEAAADNSADAIDVKTAEAQRVQSTTSKSGPDIDQILASPNERPTAPARQSGDEAAPPGPPVKSDVPF